MPQAALRAEDALADAPALHASWLWQKWGLLEILMTEEADGGPNIYPLAIVALASLKAGIMALGSSRGRPEGEFRHSGRLPPAP